jgi:hypothetical protein
MDIRIKRDEGEITECYVEAYGDDATDLTKYLFGDRQKEAAYHYKTPEVPGPFNKDALKFSIDRKGLIDAAILVLAATDRVTTVKTVRALTGCGLALAMNFVDNNVPGCKPAKKVQMEIVAVKPEMDPSINTIVKSPKDVDYVAIAESVKENWVGANFDVAERIKDYLKPQRRDVKIIYGHSIMDDEIALNGG